MAIQEWITDEVRLAGWWIQSVTLCLHLLLLLLLLNSRLLPTGDDDFLLCSPTTAGRTRNVGVWNENGVFFGAPFFPFMLPNMCRESPFYLMSEYNWIQRILIKYHLHLQATRAGTRLGGYNEGRNWGTWKKIGGVEGFENCVVFKIIEIILI